MILQMYYQNIRIEDICLQLDCSRCSIYNYFKIWDIKRRKRIKAVIRCNAIYTIDYNYFKEIDTEHKAYWYGFLLADGHINDKIINLCVQNKDIDILNQFQKDLIIKNLGN